MASLVVWLIATNLMPNYLLAILTHYFSNNIVQPYGNISQYRARCHAIKQNESELEQNENTVLLVIVCYIFRAIFYLKPHQN